MKGRCWKVVYIAATALLLATLSSHAKPASNKAKRTQSGKTRAAETRPAPAQPEGDYVVRSGDTLYAIARSHGTTAAALQTTNSLKSSHIKPGQKLVVPGTQKASATKAPRKKKERSPSQNEQVAVQYISRLREQELNAGNESVPTRVQLAEAGFKMLGVRYRFSGGSEKTGFDCSGLVKNLFSKFNIDLPRSSREQFKQGEKIDRDNLQVGDLVFFSSGGKSPTHVGIYLGNDKFLHAARKAREVVVSDLNKFWYTMRYLGARRIAELWWDEATPEEPQGE
jgi:cell wall-associated NlpC family hydrolase